MSHWLGFELGVISREEAQKLQLLKNTMNEDEYEELEKKLGVTRSQLINRFGARKVHEVEMEHDKHKERDGFYAMFRTNTKTRNKFAVRR